MQVLAHARTYLNRVQAIGEFLHVLAGREKRLQPQRPAGSFLAGYQVIDLLRLCSKKQSKAKQGRMQLCWL